MRKKREYWNYRIVAEKEKNGEGFFYSIRDVYYKDDKPTSWGAEPQYPVGETAEEVFNDIENMGKALNAPLLVVKGEKLIEHPRRLPMFAKAEEILTPTDITKD